MYKSLKRVFIFTLNNEMMTELNYTHKYFQNVVAQNHYYTIKKHHGLSLGCTQNKKIICKTLHTQPYHIQEFFQCNRLQQVGCHLIFSILWVYALHNSV